MSSVDGKDVALSAQSTPRTDLHLVEPTDQQRVADLQDELAERATHVENLETALVTSRRIGAAIGIVMATLKVTEDAAFQVLVAISQEQHRKLRLVADDVVFTGSIVPVSSAPPLGLV